MLSSRVFAAIVGAACFVCAARAQVILWAGTGVDFTLGASWVGGVPPTNDTTTSIATFGSTAVFQPALNSAYSVGGVRFTSDAASFSFTGTGPLTIGSSGIDNQSSVFQSIAVPLVFGGTTAVVHNNSALTLSGSLTNNTTSALTFSGTGGAGAVNGAISGTGGVQKSDAGVWLFSGANTYTGNTTVTGGALVVTNTTGSGTGTGAIAVSGTAELRVGNGGTAGAISGNVSVATANNSAVRFNRSDAATYAGSVSGAGNLYKDGTGTLTLTGTNTLTGATAIFDGTLRAGAANVLSPASVVVFGTTSTPTLDLNNFNQTAGGLTNNGGSTNGIVQLGSGTLTLAVPSTTGASFEGTISGTGAIVKTDTGVQFFGSANTYAGGTTVSAGTLWLTNASGSATGTGNVTVAADGALFVGNGNATGAFSGNVANAGWLRFARSDNLTYGGVISGAGILEKQGAGKLILTGANTFAGNTSINSGTLAIGSGGTTGALAGNVSVFSTLEFNRSNAYTFTGNISGNGSVVQAGSGTLTLSGANTYSGTTFVNAGTLAGGAANSLSPHSTIRINSGASLQITSNQSAGGLEDFTTGVSGNVTIAGGAALTLNRGDNAGIVYSGVLSGAGALIVDGTGPQVLAGANTYTGGTIISGGALRLGANNALPVGGNVTLSAVSFGSGTLDLQGRSQTIGSLLFNGASGGAGSSVLLGSGGTLTVNGSLAFDGTNFAQGATISGGTLVLGSANRTLNIGDSSGAFADLTITSTISAAGATLTKAGAGTLVLSGASDHAATIVSDGRLQLGASNVLPASGNVTLSGSTSFFSSTLDLGNFTQTVGALTFGGVSSNSGGAVSMADGGVLTLGGNVSFNAANNPGGAGIFGGTLALGGNRTFNVGDSTNAFSDLTITSAITGAGIGITKTGAGTLVLSGANTYTGATTINAGRLQIGFGGSLAASSPVIVNATSPGGSAVLDVGGSTAIGTLTFGGTGATSSSNNTVAISGGTLTLTGGVVFDATNNPPSANINGGTLELSGTQVFNVGNSSAAINDLVVSAEIKSGGGLTKTGTGTLLLANTSNTFAGPVAVQAGVLAVNSLGLGGSASSLGSGTSAIALGNGTTDATLRYSGFSTAITDRAIDLAGTTGGATLDLSGGGAGTVTFAGNITASGAGAKTLTLTGTSAATGAISGAISDNSATNRTAVVKTGFGTWILSGANTYTGGTTINAGTLRLSASNSLPTGGNVTINSLGGQAILDLNNTTQAIGALTFGGAGGASFSTNLLLLGSSGTLTLGGNLTFSATNNPSGGYIAAAAPFSSPNPFGGTLNLGSSIRTFDIGNSSATPFDFTILSNIAGTGGIDKIGAGSLTLAGQGTYTGNTTVSGGTLYLASSSIDSGGSVVSGPVGRGTLIMQSGTTLAATGIFTPFLANDDDITLRNAVVLASNVTLGSSLAGTSQRLTFSGTVSAASPATTWHLATDEPFLFTGTLTGLNATTSLTIDSAGRSQRGRAIIGAAFGPNLTSITADHSALIFASAVSLAHSATVNVTNNGYVGVGVTNGATPPTPAALIARIANPAAFTGTFGFDTDVENLGGPATFTATTANPIDFSAFGSGLRLGSASAAILDGPFVPGSGGYQFGNGGGLLIVRSNLTDGSASHGVTVNSDPTIPHNALLTVFEGTNTYTGNLGVTHSLALLNSPLALPAGSGINLGAGGYVGYTELFSAGGTQSPVSFGTFLSRIASYAPTSVIGLDSSDYSAPPAGTTNTLSRFGTRFVTETLDLSSLGSIYLGTATDTVIAGQVLAPNQGGANRTLSLLAAGEGHLSIFSRLGPTNVSQVVIGSNVAQFGTGTVMLANANTYTGGTTLLSGTLLLIGSSQTSGGRIVSGPIGTGALTVGPGALSPTLAATNLDNDVVVLHNAINLGGVLRLATPFDDGGSEDLRTSSTSSGYPNLILNGVIADFAGQAGSLQIATGTTLNGANTYTGGTTLSAGILALGHDSALGTGSLTISPNSNSWFPVGLNIVNGSRTLANNVVLNLFSDPYLSISGQGSLTINGSVTLNSSVTLAPENAPVFLNGAIGGSGRLSVYTPDRVFLTGANTYSGGTRAERGVIVFGSTSSIPSSGGAQLQADFAGYIGIATPPVSLQADFIDKFNKGATSGTIGFDTLPGNTPNVFSGNINLAGFNTSARLGSATTATLTGTITPSGSSYLFGGGGGLLQVNSALVNGSSVRDLQLYSPDTGVLTLRLGGANTFTGGISVGSSALIFRPGSMPAGTGNIYANFAYVGTEDTTLAPNAFLASFSSSTTHAIVGFDSFTGSPYVVGSGTTIDLASQFTSGGDPRIFLGSATNAEINGLINLPAAQANYLFAGFKGGRVTIGSALTGTRGVEIGDAAMPATFGTPNDFTAPRSSVTLSGANTYTGGTQLNAGVLYLGSNQALGTGTLTIADNELGSLHLGLFASGGARTLSNTIVLNGELDIGGDNNLSLSGAISGPGELYKVGGSNLTLSGNNTFSGGIYIAQGSVTFATATAAGTGPLQFGTSGPSASFLASSTINGLSGDHVSDTISLGTGVTLTINQTFDADFLGSIAGSGASVVYRGPVPGPVPSEPSQLRLSGASSYSGGSTLSSGLTLVAANNAALGTGAFTLNGGRLVVEGGVTLTNSLSLASGTLGGAGTVRPSSGMTAGSGVTLAPGMNAIGAFTFDGSQVSGPVLTLGSGGVYHWQLTDALASGGDLINVMGTAAITSTAAQPFTLRLTPTGSLDLLSISGLIANFDPGQSYSWSVLNATNITGFTPGSLVVDWSSITGYTAGGTFGVTLNNTNTSLMLNFTPIPEPSTYVLLSLGAAMVFLGVRRRRR